MNTDITQPSSRECARYAPLLPQLRHDPLESSVALSLRAHLEDCPLCQAQLAAYDQLDAKLRAYAHRSASSAPAPDAIIQSALAASTATHALGGVSAQRPDTLPHTKHWLPGSPRKQPAPQEVRPMRFTRQHPLVATIAALLVIVLAAVLFTTFAQTRLGSGGQRIHSTPTVRAATATSTPTTRAITAQQAWGANAATLTLDTQIDATHVFFASTISPDGKRLLGYLAPVHGTAGTQNQIGYYDIATHHFTASGIAQPWPAPPICCQTDGHYLLAALDTAPGATCGLCHRIYYSYDMDTGQLWQIAKGTDYGEVQNAFLDQGFVLLNTGQGLFEADLATRMVTHVQYPSGSTQIVSFAWPYLIYSVPLLNSSTPATHAYNLTTQADVALPQLDNLQVKGGIGATVTGSTLFLTQTTNINATHAITTLFEYDAFFSSSAAPRALATYGDQLVVRAANTRLVAFYGSLVWDRVEQRLVAFATDGQPGGGVSVALSGHYLVVIQSTGSFGAIAPQHVTVYDTDTLPTAPAA